MKSNVIFVILAVLGVFVFGCTQSQDAMIDEGAMQGHGNSMEESGEAIIEDGEAIMEEDASMDGDSMMEKGGDAMMEGESVMADEPAVLAGTATKYYDFDKNHYERSLGEGKVVFLNFYASWCPICKREQPDLFAAFGELNNENVVGYRVHYNDGDTTDDDREIAKRFGITYQHTKVIIGGNGNVALKSLEAFSKDKAINEINKVVA